MIGRFRALKEVSGSEMFQANDRHGDTVRGRRRSKEEYAGKNECFRAGSLPEPRYFSEDKTKRGERRQEQRMEVGSLMISE